jgi:hypothetical protein
VGGETTMVDKNFDIFTGCMRRDGVKGVDHHEDAGSLGRTFLGHDDVDSGRHTFGQVRRALVVQREDEVGPALEVEPDPFGQVQPGCVLGPDVEHLLVGEAVGAVLVFVGRHGFLAAGPHVVSSNA